MLIKATLYNRDHPEYGVATIPFPIPKEQYDHCIETVQALGIGAPLKKDCKVMEIDSFFSVLKIMENLCVDLDELDYLAKRLDSFDDGEAAQFQAMASKLELFKLKDLINLTFCCQESTVITDFSDLNAIGRDHYMNTHGGCALTEELENLDGTETALLLITENQGTVTPYGVVYDNGMKLGQLYDGTHFPAYLYEPPMLMIGLTSRLEPEDTEAVTWFYLPAAEGQIQRAMARSGITDPEEMRFQISESMLPEEVNAALDYQNESLYALNELVEAVDKLTEEGRKKLGAVVELASPEFAAQIQHLAENLDQFDFAPGIHTPEEYGRYMIQESGYFDYDPNLDEFYDYERYGQQRMARQFGRFTGRGYVSYQGYLYIYDLRQQELARQDKLVGRVTYASGECQEFTDPEEYLNTIREELPYPSTLEALDRGTETSNCKSRSEFIENAVQFYAGYLSGQDANAYLPPALVSAVRGMLQNSEDRICRLLFKLAVEMDMMMNVLSAGMEIPEEQLEHLRPQCVRNVKKTSGKVSLDDAVERQRRTD